MNKTLRRQRAILTLLSTQAPTSVDALTAEFKVSGVTIRKDLTKLESEGKLIRRYGGALLAPPNQTEQKQEKVSNRKKLIGQAASALLQDHQRIVIDSGSTTQTLLPFLAQKQNLVLMTNSLNVANYVTEQRINLRLLLTGGTWDSDSSSLQGQMAEKMIRAYDFDMAFIGASGIDANYGTTTFNEFTQLSQSMAAVAKHVVIMAESNKLNNKMPNQELPWSAVHTLVTDDDLDFATEQQIKRHGVTVLRAKNSAPKE